MKFSFTHLLVGTLVSDRKLFLTERREARICANGVTMRSSPWLQDQTREGSILFYFSPMRQAWYNEGRINGRTFRLAMNSNVYSIIVFPKSCALNNSCRRVAFSMYGCKLYTIYYYYSLRYTLFLFLSSSIQFQFYFSSGMEKDGEKIKSKLKGRKKNNEDKIAWNIGVFFEFLEFWNEKFWRKSEERKRENFTVYNSWRKKIFLRFYEIRRNRWKSFNFHNRKFIYKRKQRSSEIYNIRGHLKVETRGPIRANSDQLQDETYFRSMPPPLTETIRPYQITRQTKLHFLTQE